MGGCETGLILVESMQQILDILRDTILPQASRGEIRVFPDEKLQLELSVRFLELPTSPQPYRPNPYYEWIWILSGEVPVRAGDAIYELRPGDLCIFPPLQERVHLYNRDTAAFQVLCSGYWPGTLHTHLFDYAPFGTWSVPGTIISSGLSTIGTILTALHHEATADSPYRPCVLQGLVLQLIGASLRDMESALASPGLQLDAGSAVGVVLRLLHERYAEDWTLGALAAEVHLHPRYLARLFKGHTGNTVFDTLRIVRMEHAKSLMLEGSLPLEQVARAVGYRSADRFARVFRESTGQAPTRFGKRPTGF